MADGKGVVKGPGLEVQLPELEGELAGSIEDIRDMLGLVLRPAAEEFGLLLRDTLHAWRLRNLARIANKFNARIAADAQGQRLYLPPRAVHAALEGGSLVDDEMLQSMWAGLLAASCSEDPKSQTGLLLLEMLNRLSPFQARVLELGATRCAIQCTMNGLLQTSGCYVGVEDLWPLLGMAGDFDRLDLELDCMREMGLIYHGILAHSPEITPRVEVTPTAMGLQLHARCSGWRGKVAEFYGLQPGGERPARAKT